MEDHQIQILRQTLEKSSDPQVLKSSDHFFKQGEQAKVYGIRMSDISRISKEFYKDIRRLSKAEIFVLCEQLWQSGYLEEAVIACECAYSLRKLYEPEDFEVFERWLSEYVDNWASCDTLCNHPTAKSMDEIRESLVTPWSCGNTDYPGPERSLS